MDRRRLLKSLASLIALQAAPSGASIAASKTRTIIVGAGISGLAAATRLQNAGFDVVVLEAKPRIGGRLHTDWSLGAPFEVGAGWIHGPDGNPLSELADVVGAEIFRTDDESLLVFDRHGRAFPDTDLDRLDRRYEWLLARIDETFERDLPLGKAIRKIDPGALNDPLIRWAATAFTTFDTGGPPDQLSATQFDEDNAFDGDDVILTTGYDSILEPLSSGLDIRLNMPVSEIATDTGVGVSIRAGGGGTMKPISSCAPSLLVC